jgi:cardiolipin synthase
MTVANQITVGRLLLIPVFVILAAYYSASVERGAEEVGFRIAALIVFALASLSDAVDGYIARNFNQETPLGAVLDPIADKSLLLAGVITLSVTHWHTGLPIWFAGLVIARDVVIIAGVLIIKHVAGKVEMGPIRSSKICTFLQLSTVVWVLLDFWSKEGRPLALDILIYLAAAFTIFSGSAYVKEGLRQLRESGHTDPKPHDS